MHLYHQELRIWHWRTAFGMASSGLQK